jgi:hypothetical protein
MKTNSILFIFIITLFFGISCDLDALNGNGKITLQERSATGFSDVFFQTVGNVNIHFAENYNVKVITDSNLLDIITTEVNGSNLFISTINNSNINPTKLTIDVYMPELLNVYLQSSGTINITGKAAELKIYHQGSGTIEAANYEVQTVFAYIQGTGNIKTWAVNTLNANISTSGDILYKGDPMINRNISRTSTGKIKRL